MPVLVYLKSEQAERRNENYASGGKIMNYIAELKAFYDRLELNPLPTPAIALWHALMSIANKTGWQQEFTVAVSVLVLKSGLNAQAIKRARNRLEQEGFLTWRSRSGNQSAIYHMNSLVVQNDNKNVLQTVPQQESKSPMVQNDIKNVPQIEPQSVPQSEPQSVPQIEPQSVPINKQKRNETYHPPIPPLTHFEEFWSAYPKQQRRALTEKAYCDLVLSGDVTEEALVKAAQNYAEYIQITKEKIYLPNNFLDKHVFEDFLPGKYQKPNSVQVQRVFGDKRDVIPKVSIEQKNRIEELVKEQTVSVQNGNMPEVRY